MDAEEEEGREDVEERNRDKKNFEVGREIERMSYEESVQLL